MAAAREWVPTGWDVAVATSVAVGIVANAVAHLATPPVSASATTFGLLAAAALLGRSRFPVAAMFVVMVCSLVPTLVAGTFPDFYASFVPTLAVFYAVAARGTARQAALVPVVGTVVLVSFAARVPAFRTPSEAVYVVVGLGLAFTAGRTMRMLRHRVDLEVARADLIELERDVQAREAVLAERERIARELHDVIAHDVAVMVVQAGAAQRLLPDRAGDVADSLAHIQSSGRKAIDELHLLLGMLRDEDQALAVTPGLHAVAPLIHELAAVGLPVALDVTGTVRDVGEALDASAYRVIQESLTNVLKHAAGSHAHVDVDYGSTDLTIRVVNDGGRRRDGNHDRPAHGLPSSGHGLIGMRERVRLFGGSFAAGNSPGGGWAVTAVMPIPATAP